MMGTPNTTIGTRRSQRGMVLMISLLLLLVLTVIGLAATRTTTLDERTAVNQRDQDLAFQAAEAALRDGESQLKNASPHAIDDRDGYYDSAAAITWQTADWTGKGDNPDMGTLTYAGALNPAPAHMPRFYLVRTAQTLVPSGESLATDPGVYKATIYTVIAKGWGASDENAVVLESTYLVSKPGSGRRLSWQQLQPGM